MSTVSLEAVEAVAQMTPSNATDARRFFPPNKSVYTVALITFVLFLETIQNNRYIFVIVIMHHYTKLSRTVPTSQTTAKNVVSLFMDHRLAQYAFPTYLVTDNEDRFENK